jgi:hypothetical protein
MTPTGLPHSEISGSTRVCRSPKLIAAYHVLHRLSVPRHPPYALHNLIITFASRQDDSQMIRFYKTHARACARLHAKRPFVPHVKEQFGSRAGHCTQSGHPLGQSRLRVFVRTPAGTPSCHFQEHSEVENMGFEPTTSWLQTRRSSQLS